MTREAKSPRHRSNAVERRMVDGVVAWTDHDRDVLSAYGKKLSALELASALGGRHTIAAVKDELLRLSLRAQP